MDRGDGGIARYLVVIGATALIGSLLFRALANELDLDPIWIVLILWALLTAGFLILARARSRRQEIKDVDQPDDSDEAP